MEEGRYRFNIQPYEAAALTGQVLRHCGMGHVELAGEAAIGHSVPDEAERRLNDGFRGHGRSVDP
jgi:hypothetical protein